MDPGDSQAGDIRSASKWKLLQHFLETCASHPDSTAIAADAHALTYKQLHKAAGQVQSILNDVGVRQTQIVAICIPRSSAVVAAVVGCVLHGAVFLLVDPALPAQRMQLQFEISKPRAVLYSVHDHSKIESVLHTCAVPIEGIGVQMEGECITFPRIIKGSQGTVENISCSNDVFYIIFTSGSTGIPKAVCASASGSLNRFEWMWNEFPFQSNDVVCFKTSVNFVDCIWEVLGAVLKGVCLAIPLEEEAKDPRLLVAFMKKWRVTRVTFVPSYLRHFLEFTAAPDSLQSLTHCISSGEPLSLSLARMFLEAAPSCRLLNLYGTSEICGDVTYFEVTHESLAKTSSLFAPIGKPIPNVQVEVVDPSTGEIITQNSTKPGELLTYGVCVACSYLNSNDKSLAHTSDRSIFNTHDLVHYNSSGDLMYIGRRDHQIKVRGVRINPSEIEAVLEKNNIIERAVVVTDEAHMNLIGFVQVSRDHHSNGEPYDVVVHGTATFFINAPLAEAISVQLLNLLPQYLIPTMYIFTHGLPTLPSGKVSRKELPTLSQIKKLLSKSVNESKPLSKTEEQLCSVIKSLLQFDSIPLTGNFFALGGNSLSAIELASNIEEKLHCSIAVSTIISSPTIEALAAAIDDELAKNAVISTCSHSIDSNDTTGPLTFGQESIQVTEIISSCDIYEVGVAAKCLQHLDIDNLRKSIHYLAMNHESLRTLFPCTSYGQPYQKVLDAGSAEFLSVLQSGFHAIDCSKEHAVNFICGQISLPQFRYNLSSGPLWKFTLFTNVITPGQTDSCSILAFQAHHIMTDGWSMQLLLAELEDNYMKCVKGDIDWTKPHNSLKPLYAIQQAKQEHSMRYNDSLKFWEQKLQNAALPLFFHPKCIPSYKKNHESFSVHRVFKTSLREISSFCQANSVTEFMLALTGLLVTMYALNGLQDSVVIIPNASRIPENMKISGLFDNCLPLRTTFSSSANLHFLLQSVRENVINMIQNAIPSLVIEKELFRKGLSLPNHPFFSGLIEQLLFVCDYANTAAFSNSVLFQNIPTLHPATDYAMEFYVTITTDGFDVQAIYSNQLYDETTVQALLNTWENTIETMIKHVYLYSPLKLLCLDLHVATCTRKHEEELLSIDSDKYPKSLASPLDPNGKTVVAICLDCREQITQQQLWSIQQNLGSIINGFQLDNLPTIVTDLPFSATFLALVYAVTGLNCKFSSQLLTGILGNGTNDIGLSCIVVTDNTDHEVIIKALQLQNQPVLSFISSQSLLALKSTDKELSSQRANLNCFTGLCSEVKNAKSNLLSDVKVCSYLATKYFTAVRSAAVFLSFQYTMLPLATGLLHCGISVHGFTYAHIDSFVEFVSKTGVEMIVIPEVIVPSVLPRIVECKNIKYLWIHGLPLGLAYLSSWMVASQQHVQVIVTHSLLDKHHLITHHLNLKDIPSVEDGNIPCIPIGRMCPGLNGKVLHRDGRDVCQGFIGSFATVEGNQVHQSTSLVRELPKDSSFELVSVNAEAYYKGIDVTPALFVLSTIPEVSWCGVSQDTGKESTKILYSSPNVEGSRAKIRETVLSYLSLSYLGIIYPVSCNFPITPDLKLDQDRLSIAEHDSLLGPPLFSVYKGDKDVEKIVQAVSKAFGIDTETVWRASDLYILGGISTTNILALTVELNNELKGDFIIPDVYEAVRNGHLIDLVRSKRQK